MKNFSMITFLPLYALSILIPISLNSWLTMWMGFEINLFLFILTLTHTPSVFTNEIKFKYFLIQSLGSLILLLSLTLNFHFFEQNATAIKFIPSLALMMKMGAAPLHVWVPYIASKMPPLSLVLFLTFQKISPLLIMNYFHWSPLIWISLFNIVTGTILGITESSATKLLIFSSINNIGWMMMAIFKTLNLFFFFFLTYTIITIITIALLHNLKSKWITQVKTSKQENKMIFYLNMLSLSGLPPLLGFSPKWLVLNKVLHFNLLLPVISVLCATIILFFYLKLVVNLTMNYSTEKKWNNKNFFTNFNLIYFNFFNLLGIPLFFTLT